MSIAWDLVSEIRTGRVKGEAKNHISCSGPQLQNSKPQSRVVFRTGLCRKDHFFPPYFKYISKVEMILMSSSFTFNLACVLFNELIKS